LQKRVYFYFNNGSWSISASIPSIYTQVNFRTSRQIELDFYQDRPYRYNSVHIVKYKGKKSNNHKAKHKGKPHNQGKGKPGNNGKGK